MLKDLILKKLRYDYDTTISILDHLELNKVNEELILKVVAHLSAAKLIWIERIIKDIQYSNGVWPDLTLEESKQIFISSNEKWNKFVTEVSEPELLLKIDYKTSTGIPTQNVLIDIIEHVINHGTHHRAQIVAKLKPLNISTIPTDYILWAMKQN